eukprot:365303-Chlamydomonas_euryale.AAC.21
MCDRNAAGPLSGAPARLTRLQGRTAWDDVPGSTRVSASHLQRRFRHCTPATLFPHQGPARRAQERVASRWPAIEILTRIRPTRSLERVRHGSGAMG